MSPLEADLNICVFWDPTKSNCSRSKPPWFTDSDSGGNEKAPVIVNLSVPSPTSQPPYSPAAASLSAQRPLPPLSSSTNKYKVMGRHARSGSNANNAQIVRNNAGNANLNQPRVVENEFPIPATAGMSPGSRYSHNLKVLRRRDPSIVSIFDQFSHVCLYHHNGEKWEKKGYEGSMFLYERWVCVPQNLQLSCDVSRYTGTHTHRTGSTSLIVWGWTITSNGCTQRTT